MSESVVEVPLHVPLPLLRLTSTGSHLRPREVGLVTMNGDDSQQRWRQMLLVTIMIAILQWVL